MIAEVVRGRLLPHRETGHVGVTPEVGFGGKPECPKGSQPLTSAQQMQSTVLCQLRSFFTEPKLQSELSPRMD